MKEDIRYIQRFANFEKAFFLLKEVCEDEDVMNYKNIAKEGVIQRFESTFELMWKTLKDYLEFKEIEVIPVSPKQVIKMAASSRVLEVMGVDGEILFDMANKRNAMAHTYNETNFNEVFSLIMSAYYGEVRAFYNYLWGVIFGEMGE